MERAVRVLACQRDDCPLERTREAINAMRATFTAQHTSKWSKCDYISSCAACGMTRGWKRDEDGTEREISQDIIWGRAKDNAA